MSKLLINISYASLQAYEFDGIKNIDDVQKYQFHQVLDIQINGEPSTRLDIKVFFDELTKELSDAYGNGWKNNIVLAVLWSPEFSDTQKSEFKRFLSSDGVENFDFYEPKALSNYLLQRLGKFNATCSYTINLWSNSSDVYIQLYHNTEDGQFKCLGKTIAEKAAEDPRVPYLTDMMMKDLRHYVHEIDAEESMVRAIAENFIKSGKSVSNEIVTLSSGYKKIFTLTDEYRDCDANESDILNKSLSSLLNKNNLDERECQVVLSSNFVDKQNLLDVVTRMFTYVCEENYNQDEAIIQAAFKQMEYTIKTSENLQQRIAFCGDGYVIDRPILITWTCQKCGYSCECVEAPKECPNCHGNEIPAVTGNLFIDAVLHESRSGCFWNRQTDRHLEIDIAPINGGISAKLLLIVGKKPIGVYNSNIGVGRWIHEFPNGIHEKVSIVVTQDEYPELAQSGATYIDIKPHFSYQDVNAFIVKTKKI